MIYRKFDKKRVRERILSRSYFKREKTKTVNLKILKHIMIIKALFKFYEKSPIYDEFIEVVYNVQEK